MGNLNFYVFFNSVDPGPNPEDRNTGGIEWRWYDVSGVSREGESMRGGFSPLI